MVLISPLARCQPLKIQIFLFCFFVLFCFVVVVVVVVNLAGFFLYFYPQYLTSSNSKAYQPYHFLKELSGALKYFTKTETNFLLSSGENAKNEPFSTF